MGKGGIALCVGVSSSKLTQTWFEVLSANCQGLLQLKLSLRRFLVWRTQFVSHLRGFRSSGTRQYLQGVTGFFRETTREGTPLVATSFG